MLREASSLFVFGCTCVKSDTCTWPLRSNTWSGGGLTFNWSLSSEVKWNYCIWAAVDLFCCEGLARLRSRRNRAVIPLWSWRRLACFSALKLWERRCGREWHCRSRSDCLYSGALLSAVAKNNPAPQDKEDRLEGGVFPFPSLLSLYHSLSSLPHQIQFILSFIHYLHSDCFPSYLLSIWLQLEVSTSKAPAPAETLATTQARFAASAHAAKTGRAVKYRFQKQSPALTGCLRSRRLELPSL